MNTESDFRKKIESEWDLQVHFGNCSIIFQQTVVLFIFFKAAWSQFSVIYILCRRNQSSRKLCLCTGSEVSSRQKQNMRPLLSQTSLWNRFGYCVTIMFSIAKNLPEQLDKVMEADFKLYVKTGICHHILCLKMCYCVLWKLSLQIGNVCASSLTLSSTNTD